MKKERKFSSSTVFCSKERRHLQTEDDLDTVVCDNDDHTAETTENFWENTLEHTGHAFVSHDFASAVDTGLVCALFLGDVRLKHHTTTDSVEWVVEWKNHGTSNGTNQKSGKDTNDAFVIFVWVEAHDGSVKSKLASTVHEGTCDGNGGTTVQTGETLLGHGLGEAVHNAVELSLSSAEVRSKTGSCEVKRVADNHCSSTTETSRKKVVNEVFSELLVLVDLWEKSIEEVVESKSGTLLRSVTEAVDQVTAPESADALLSSDTTEAVHNTSVWLDFSGDDPWVGVHGLHQDLHTFHRRHNSLGQSTNATTDNHVLQEGLLLLLLLLRESQWHWENEWGALHHVLVL